MRYKYCPRCGTKLPIDSRFCVKCGYKFTHDFNQDSQNTQSNQDNQPNYNQNTQQNNQDTEQGNNQEANQTETPKQNIAPQREAVHQPKSHHSHQGMWVLVVIIVLILGLGGYAIHEQRANHYGNNVSKVNQKSKSFTKTTAQNVLEGTWQSAQNEINDGEAKDNDNIPMDTYFTSDNNSDYQRLNHECKHMYNKTKNKPHSKYIHFKVRVLSKTPNSHRTCNVKYVVVGTMHGIKPYKNTMHATFKLTSSGGGDWAIYRLGNF